MTRPQSSVKVKPKKPYEGFPLTASTNGQWVKKINGKVYSFGRWEDHEAAMDLYEFCLLYTSPSPRDRG